MQLFQYKEAEKSHIPGMAKIRAAEWGSEEYWNHRIAGYMNCELHPQQALMPRVAYVALHQNAVIGFIAGHLTKRYDCDGELQWINVIPEYRGNKVAEELLRLLAAWFTAQHALYICVDADPENAAAQKFYKKHGAENLNKHWLVWKDISILLKHK